MLGSFAISPNQLAAEIGRQDAPLVFDVCMASDYEAQSRLVPGARWRDHKAVATWASEIPQGQRVALVCVRGKKVSQATAAALRREGIDASYLDGGLEAWLAAGLTSLVKCHGIGNREGAASRWVTRVRPKIDRIACPWLIRRFIDPAAEFYYVEPSEVVAAARELDAIPFDVPGVELTHRGERDSFDAILEDFDIHDAALDKLATIVRGADTAQFELAPEAAGLLAIAIGISHLADADDRWALDRGFTVYDGLYAWARFASDERHNWPAARTGS